MTIGPQLSANLVLRSISCLGLDWAQDRLGIRTQAAEGGLGPPNWACRDDNLITRALRGLSGPSVWTGRALQAESDDLEVIGLALLYPALERNVWVPGHDGYPRALDLIRVSAPKAIRAT